MATSVSLRPTTTTENVGKAALFLSAVFFLLAYGSQIAAVPFVNAMGETSKTLVTSIPKPNEGLRITAVKERRMDWAAQSSKATSMNRQAPRGQQSTTFQLRK